MSTKSKKNIEIIGARVHNLQNINVAIPRNKLTVITGVSGSGKSSLAFDTLYAEGHRRYIESLSAYARLFLGRIEKPDIDDIKGISPAIAIEQKVNSSNPRSTVGTTTEIYDYLKLLFARVGKTISPISNKQVKKDSPEDVLNWILTLPEKSKLLISVDTSLVHLAAALKIPVLGLYSNDKKNFARYSPLSSNAKTVNSKTRFIQDIEINSVIKPLNKLHIIKD